MSVYSSQTDAQLLNLLKQDDRGALNEIYRRYQGLLYSHAYRRLADREEVRDIIQELFVYLWTNRHQIQLNTSLSAYLYASVRNRVLNLFRNKKVRDNFAASLQEFIDRGETVIEEQFREKELRALIEKEIEAMPAQMRMVFEMSRKMEMSHQEIAEALNISPHTVRNQVHNALKILRGKLGQKGLLLLF
ncbi:RNA polymerase sigma-70 factor [Pedobacter faecalis]|uniref:RNA polymerase sigma-70 factor n=1 Tax=Pedobacter faecalis TaxID=3041495 RepID=UPI00255143EB|nr:RNA polymerase sigma-70 factor [Pedobacter sp. ELA7]